MVFVLIFIAIVCIICYQAFVLRPKKIAIFKEKYDEALRSGDKRKALEQGRLYYKSMRGKLSIYDEQAISNDIASMQ